MRRNKRVGSVCKKKCKDSSSTGDFLGDGGGEGTPEKNEKKVGY